MYYLGQFIYKNTEQYSPLFVNKFSVYYRYRLYAVLLLLGSVVGLEAKICPTYPDFVKKPLAQQRCSKAIQIKPSDIGPTGYVISRSGTYCLSGAVTFEPTKPGQAAITIKADNVNLVLSGATFTQKGEAANTHGLYIDSALETTVFGGTFENFTGNAVYFSHATAVAIEGITCSNNPGNGIYFEQVHGIFVILCNAKNNTGKGLWFDRSTLIMLESCVCTKNDDNQDIQFS